MKKIIALGAVLVAVLGGIYFGSAYWATSNLKDAVLSGDSLQIERAVDFPSVRESLKSQMTQALTDKMENDPELADNPFAGLGMLLAPAIIDTAIDAYVTPEGLAKAMQGKRPNEESESASEDVAFDYETEWVDSDLFRVRILDEDTGEAGPSLIFERRGFATWKLIKLELPPETFAE